MVELLGEFVELFEPLRGLPPQRLHDHIHLLLGLPPATVRPYRYP